MGFNKSQEIAINHNKGPMLVLAGPGSGKTLVITQRTKKLIEEYGVNPARILVITFTKAASIEMRDRFIRLMDGEHMPVTFGTFHSVYFKILKYAYNYGADNIIREEDRLRYLKEIIDKYELEIDDESDFISSITNEISSVKSDMIDLNNYYSVNCSEEIFKKIYTDYDNRLRRANVIDFDDMLVMCYELLTARPDILRGWQQKYEYILIDEFQDINKIQYDVIKLLAGPENNLFIVGDDDQSIYRFRGARPEIMLNFTKDYEDAKTVLLDTNYRCSGNIVEGSIRVIENNKTRFDKKIRANNEAGDNIIIREYKEPQEENKKIVDEIIEYNKKGIEYEDIAILFRTNVGPRLLVEKLMEYNIPFRMKDNLPNMYDHFIAKSFIAYIKIALGSNDRADFLKIINRPKRYINRNALSKSEITIDYIREQVSDKDWMVERIDKLEYDLGMLKTMAPYAAINYIRKGIGYDEYLKEYADYRRMNVNDLYNVADELQESSKEYRDYDEWFAHIDEYSEELKRQIKNRNTNSKSVSLATMHSSKGLEYKVVFIIDANETITPHNKAVLEEDIEEERRMFYVAMTRAKEHLHIYYVKERYNKKLAISRFVTELLTDVKALTVGTMINHKRYGDGVIRKNEDGKLIVYFKKIGREIVLDINFCISYRMIEIINNKK